MGSFGSAMKNLTEITGDRGVAKSKPNAPFIIQEPCKRQYSFASVYTQINSYNKLMILEVSESSKPSVYKSYT